MKKNFMVTRLSIVNDYFAYAEYMTFTETVEEAEAFIKAQPDHCDYDIVDITGEKPQILKQRQGGI